MWGLISFVRAPPDASLLYYGFFDPVLVCLSITIAIFGSYSALLVIQHLAGGRTLARHLWRVTAGLCMGAGIWAMHFVGMLAFSLPCSTSYDPILTALSVIPAVLACMVAVAMISRRPSSPGRVTAAGLLLGAGIGAMHFSGMAAMHLAGSIRYDPLLFALSIAIAMLLAVLALWIRTSLLSLPGRWSGWATPISAVVIGLAVSGMHYTAMAAAYFIRDESSVSASSPMAPGFLASVALVVSAAVIIFTLIAYFLARPSLGRPPVPYRGIAVIMVCWSVASWLITDYYSGEREIAAYRKGMETAQQRVEAVAQNVENEIAMLGGIAALISKSPEMRTLIQRTSGEPLPAAADVAARRREWTDNPILADTGRFLANVATNLGADVVYLLNAGGDCLAASNFDGATSFVGTNFADRDYFRQAQSGRTGLQYAFGRVSKVAGLYTSHPIVVDQRFLGAVIVKRNVSDFVRWIRQTNAFIADGNGVIILSEDSRLLSHILPGAAAAQRPEDLLQQQYGQRGFAQAEILPWKIGAFPGLASIGKGGEPVAIASKRIFDGALNVNVPLPLPEISRIEAERWWLFLLLALPGTTLIAAVTSFLMHLRAMRRAKEAIEKQAHELAAANASLDSINRALAFLSSSNRALLRATEVHSYLDEVCRLATEQGGYLLAWVGLAEQDEAKRVRPIARAGSVQDYLDSIDIRWADNELGRGPTGTAIRTGQRIISRSILTDPAFSPWRETALRYGFQSSIALPLRVEGEIFGALALHSGMPDAFDQHETELLSEVADDLALGIEMLQTRQARKRAEEELKHAARTDFLTGLANRASLTEFLNQQFANGGAGALLFVDLERFKEINDSQGYMVGDSLLRILAERLSAGLRDGELLGRIGGDEFALVVPGADETAARHVAERLKASLVEPFIIAGFNSSLGAKIGIGLYPDGRQTADEIFADAGLASRMAGNKPGGINFYSPQLSAALSERLEIAHRLKLALAEGQLQLHYQPKFEMATGRLHGAEALLRWQDPVLGAIRPDLFVPIAEERGLMPVLGRWVIEESCRQLSAWKAAGLVFPGRLAINVSVMQFDSPDFVATATDLVKAAGRSPADFELEITESTLMADSVAAIAMMKELTDKGFACAIDDFGTGFSSLAYLSQFPAVTLKIDKSFVHSMLSNATDLVIVETIVGMAKTLGLAIVAEGVETEEQAEALLKLKCGVAQGYHFGQPEPPELFAEYWLKERSSAAG
jgi:diguanylate cyclase (GGDEF)-like protein